MTGLRLAYLLGQAASEFRRTQAWNRSAMQREGDSDRQHAMAEGGEHAYHEVLKRLDAVIREAEASP